MSTIVAATLSNGTVSTSTANCIQGSAKAWVNFNGTTSPGTIRASYNVSSVTRNSTGDYTANFTNALADTNFACLLTGGSIGTFGTNAYEGSAGVSPIRTTSSVRFETASNGSNVLVNENTINLAVFR
jgi:hypothetical protein